MRWFGRIAAAMAAVSAAGWAATGEWHALGVAAAYGLLARVCLTAGRGRVAMASGWSPRGETDAERMLEGELRRTEERIRELRREIRREKWRLAWRLAALVGGLAALVAVGVKDCLTLLN